MDLRAEIEERFRPAFDALLPGADPVVRPSDRADFQVNGAIGLARRLGRDPLELARDVLAGVELADLCESAEVSGNGFVNLTVSTARLAAEVAALAGDERLGVAATPDPTVVVVDYSAPNVAKEMHVGHLRSTIIGDVLVRVLGFLGNDVVKENHVGDWGTPFGMLIEHLLDIGENEAVRELSVGDLSTFYRQARVSFDNDPSFAERARRRVVLLQRGDPETIRLWRILVDESLAYFDEVYKRLGVLLTRDDVVGESFYNPMLPAVVADLDAAGLLVEDAGALCVFPPGFSNREGEALPLIVQKHDEGFGYAATDLAAIRDRVDRIGAGRICYVVGSPQAQHLQMCFAVATMAGWLPATTRAEHVAFGSVLGADRKVLRTRSGDTVRLVDLLDEADARAAEAVAARWPEMDPAEQATLAPLIANAALKYADLSNDRRKDYVFDLERMVQFEGDTGPYLQYAHARCRSILRRSEVADREGPVAPLLEAPEERALGLALLGLEEAVRETAAQSAPNRLCLYLSQLAGAFTAFYDACPVLQAPDAALRRSRLLLCELVARTLALGLDLLGIVAPERM